ASGTNQQFTATGIYSDGTTANLTDQVAWSSSSGAVATISNAAGSLGLATGAALGAATITATSGTVSGSATLAVSNATLRTIQVSGANTAIALGTSEQFTATGIYSDGTSQDITSLVTWGSSMTGVALLSNSAGSRGLCTSVAAGATSITATLGTITGSRSLTVTSATLSSIAVTPGGSFLARGTQQQFTATGIYSDGNQQDLTATVSWSSSASAIASIDNSTGSEGLVTALAAGTATITATDLTSGKTGTTRVTVTSALLTSIAITPANRSIAKGTSVQLTATGTYNDGRLQDLTALVTWTSSGSGVSVSNSVGSEGLAQGVAVGPVTITARLSGTTGTTTLTVTSASLVSIAVTPASAELPVSFSRQYVATGLYSDGSTQILTSDPTLSWTSSDMSLATISNAAGSEGLAQGVATGAVTITATVGAISGTTRLTITAATLMSITVMPATATIAVGGTQKFTALAMFDDGLMLDVTASVTWESDDATRVAIDPTGLATATGAAGDTATISATIGAVSGTAAVTVS
ncbi:MAG TPA: Ig-like domain-containing protein, partial [Pseudomonadota bacterium]|nr:Ig-like domain-containing protein [Pseudomonadota bacterium]